MDIVLSQALQLAAERHKNQRRKDKEGTPYINHPLSVMGNLVEVGVSNVRVLAAAVLHDVIEDTNTTEAELRALFGSQITDLVMEVSDDKSLPKEERKRLQVAHAGSCTYEAGLIKLSDKLSNLRDLASSPPEDWSRTRILAYRDWALEVVAPLRGTCPRLEAAIDEAAASLI